MTSSEISTPKGLFPCMPKMYFPAYMGSFPTQLLTPAAPLRGCWEDTKGWKFDLHYPFKGTAHHLNRFQKKKKKIIPGIMARQGPENVTTQSSWVSNSSSKHSWVHQCVLVRCSHWHTWRSSGVHYALSPTAACMFWVQSPESTPGKFPMMVCAPYLQTTRGSLCLQLTEGGQVYLLPILPRMRDLCYRNHSFCVFSFREEQLNVSFQFWTNFNGWTVSTQATG